MSRTEFGQEAAGDGQSEAAAVHFDVPDGETGVRVVDPIDRCLVTLHTPEPVEPRRTEPSGFTYPIDAAASFETTAVGPAVNVGGHVRENGDVVATLSDNMTETFDAGRYSIELFGPIKLYLRVDGPFRVDTHDSTQLQFDEPTTVTVGARSLHRRPAATVTTTSDPEDMMRAVSTFGSALKTTDVERSYPTLRGHPPAVERGEELHIPDGLELPETGLRLEVPPELGAIYVVAPLAYYLGARVEAGPRPRLVSENGSLDYALDGPLGFEETVERVLKQIFFLDCLTRTEGEYITELHERDVLEDKLDLDFEALYDASLTEQVTTYLDVPFETIEPHLPTWKLIADVEPTAESVESIPYLLDDLAILRTPQVGTAEQGADTSALDGFFRGRGDTEKRSITPVTPAPADSIEQAWVGERAPLRASKASPTAYRNRLDRPGKTGDIDITVVCNDPEMVDEEGVVDDAYGDRHDLPLDVTLHRQLSTDELRTVLTGDTDFLHYIGHIDAEGFRCPDGHLDAITLETTGVGAFLLNACASYEQGMALVEAGSIGGVVTLSDVVSSGAIEIGKTVARLLNVGFPLDPALGIARAESLVGSQYTVIGDGGFAITQSESISPPLYRIERQGPEFVVEVEAFLPSQQGMGSAVKLYTDKASTYYLPPGKLDTFHFTREECREFFEKENVPTRVDGELHWSQELDLSDV